MDKSKGERLQKVLAQAGVASRRHAEELITAGRVRVNGRVVSELGTRVLPGKDKIEVDGKRIVAEAPVYYLFHKPRGVVTTLHDPEGRQTIGEFTRDLEVRVFPVGRLDFNTSGALLLTNDGALAQALLHPRRKAPKTYVCKVKGVPTDLQLDAWREGLWLKPTPSDPDEPAVKTQPAEVAVLRTSPSGEDAQRDVGTTWLRVTLYEGRTRQIHRMAEATGLFVMRLARISFAGLSTEGLRPGELRALTDKEITALRVTYLRPVEEAARHAADDSNDPDDEDSDPTDEAPAPPRASPSPRAHPAKRSPPARPAARPAPRSEPRPARPAAAAPRRAGPRNRG